MQRKTKIDQLCELSVISMCLEHMLAKKQQNFAVQHTMYSKIIRWNHLSSLMHVVDVHIMSSQ
jgi:hypothetical protein